MSFAATRKQLQAALDTAGVRYALRFPNQKSGTLVVDLDPSPENLALAQRALAKLRAKGPWSEHAAWLAAAPRMSEHTAGAVMLTTTLAAPAPAPGPSDEAALLAAIAAAPDDDASRLVYADLLMSRGDPHGELIVLQCRRAAGDTDPKLGTRIAAMLETGWKAYAGELAPYTSPRDFHRGFVNTVTMTIAAFVRYGEHAFVERPTYALEIANHTFSPTDLQKLARTPALARVRSLGVTQRVGVAERAPIAALAESPDLSRLESLTLRGCGHSAADWTKLFERLNAPALRSIAFHYSHTSASIAKTIAANPTLRDVRHYFESVRGSLDTTNAAARTREAFAALASTLPLETVGLEGSEHFDDDVISLLFAPHAAANVRSLHLHMTAATNQLLRTIARSPKVAALEQLEINDEGAVTIDGVRELLAAAPRLHRLAMKSHAWTDVQTVEYQAMLVALPANSALRIVGVPWRVEGSQALEARFEVER